jgi:hypothetical protein
MNAQIVKEGSIHQKEFDIQLELPPGSYIIMAETKKGWSTQKLLIIN